MADKQDNNPASTKKESTTDQPQATQTKGSGAKQDTMDIKVYAPFKVYYDGKGTSLSAVNESGPFDILPQHRNFLCMLLPCNLVVRTNYDEKTIKIGRALMHVREGKVTVFVDV